MLENILRFQVFGSNTFRHILNMIYNNRLCRLANCDKFENDVSDHDNSQDSLVEQQEDNSTRPVLTRDISGSESIRYILSH